MKIFIRQVPAGLSEWELRGFITRAFGYRRFLPFMLTPKMTSCGIMRIKDQDVGVIEYHGVVVVVPDDAARDCVRKLNRTRLRGKLVEVREFHDRSFHNERRVNRIDRRSRVRDPSSALAKGRRLRDRRRDSLVVTVVGCPTSREAAELYKTFGAP
jgi:hypothetical protein